MVDQETAKREGDRMICRIYDESVKKMVSGMPWGGDRNKGADKDFFRVAISSE